GFRPWILETARAPPAAGLTPIGRRSGLVQAPRPPCGAIKLSSAGWPLPAACRVPRLGERADRRRPGWPRRRPGPRPPPDPAHPPSGRFRVLPEFLRHPGRAAADAELPYRAPDRIRDRLGSRVIRPLEF